MSDEPITDAAPVPIRPGTASETSPPPESVVRNLHASLRATEVYLRVLIDRIELSLTSDLVRLDAVPPDALLRLTTVSDSFHGDADLVLGHLSPEVAWKAQGIADMARASAHTETTR